ncbi:CDP-glycerol glycerophosphotransferase family protein [Vibrio breoganii]
MNVNKFLLLRALNQLRGLIPSLIMLLYPLRKKRVIVSSEFNEFYNYCSKYLFESMLKDQLYEVKFVVNDAQRRSELKEKLGDHFIESKSLKGIFYILSSKTWITSSLETPIGGFGLALNRTVLHLSHGAPVKAIGLSAKQLPFKKKLYYSLIKHNFSHFVSTAKPFDDAWIKCLGVNSNNIVRAPLCRNISMIEQNKAAFFEGNNGDGKHKRILYAPTWRPYEETVLFPFSDFDIEKLERYLSSQKAILYLRLHPNFEKDIDKNLLSDKVKVLRKQDIDDINEVLHYFDMLITDYSSIYVDYLLLNRPIVFLPYDFQKYKNTVGFSIDYWKYSPGLKPTSFDEFLSALGTYLKDPRIDEDQRCLVNDELNPYSEGFVTRTKNIVYNLINSGIIKN